MDINQLLSSRKLGVESVSQPSSSTSTGGASFAENIGETLAAANQDLKTAETSARDLAEGKGDLVETMLAMGRADLSLRMVVNMRNRMLESYNEIMRLQV